MRQRLGQAGHSRCVRFGPDWRDDIVPVMAPPAPFARRRVLAGTVGLLGAAAITPLILAGRDDEPALSPASDSMRWADRSRGVPFSKDPSVVRFGDRYLMYFSVPPKASDRRWGQAVAVSADLVSWETIAELEPQGDAEARGLCAGGAIVLGERVHLFYQTYGRGLETQSATPRAATA